MGVARAVPLNSTMPLFSAIAGIYVLGEKPGLYILAGTVLIVLGCMGITRKRGGASHPGGVTCSLRSEA